MLGWTSLAALRRAFRERDWRDTRRGCARRGTAARSYFSLGSLARLFRASGFDVLQLERGFDDQYLTIDARLATGAEARVHRSEESLDEPGLAGWAEFT